MGSTALDGLPRCPHCAGHHGGACPRVKRITYRPNGTVESVEYHPPPPAPPGEHDALVNFVEVGHPDVFPWRRSAN